MISNNRGFDKKEFIGSKFLNKFPRCGFFYPFSRQGLYQFLKEEKYKTVLLPSYIAEGVIDPFKKLDYVIKFYDIDQNGYINENIFNEPTDIFVYIHHFGLYNETNIEIIKRKKDCYTLFIEDFAHTVFEDDLILNGDICLFSFTKIIGVAEGSCILFNTMDVRSCQHTKKWLLTFKIRLSLYIRIIVMTYFKTHIVNVLIDHFLNLFKWYDYYTLVMKTYIFNYPSIESYSDRKLHCVKFSKISQRRKEYANLYLNKLEPVLLFDIPKCFYQKQALFAFPIKVINNLSSG